MPTPMPSPNGSNLERLYISRSPFVGARDAAPDMPEATMRTLIAKFSENDKAMLRALLDEDSPSPSSASDRARANDSHVAPEERERIRLMINAFGERVSGSNSTSAQAVYEARFPNSNRLK